MVIAAALILTVFCFIAIAVPFFRNGDNSVRAWLFEFEDSSKKTDSGRTLFKQLETDYRTGILSEEDYRSQKNSLQGTTAGAVELKTEGASSLDEEIENRVAGLRGGGEAAPDDEIEENVRQLRSTSIPAGSQPAAAGSARQAKARYCSNCGAKVQPGGRFCSRCGEQLN
ncbi:MAG: zinc ribbon domain-containing protein [Dehalococcoidales bacterium]|nr:zinc ribbon domain-containing protein [Dehalococcoidales bacterium]